MPLPIPVFTAWLIPLGFALLAEDIPFVRHIIVLGLDKVELHRPEWLQRKRR